MAWAAPAGEASRYLQQKQEEVAKLMRKQRSEKGLEAAAAERLQKIVDGLLDYQELSRRALDTVWQEHSEKERQEFVSLLRRLVERNYRDNVHNTLDYVIKYQREEPEDQALAVYSVARSRKNARAPAISIDYRVHRQGEGWSIFDITTDGVSLVDNYRKQFRRIIKKDGWNGLMQRMRSKVAEQKS